MDYCKVNSLIKHKPHPLPKIQSILQKLEGFQYATALDISMRYWYIELFPNAQRIYALVLP